MKSIFKAFAVISMITSLVACNGGSSTDTSGSAQVTTLIKTDTVVGTGTVAAAGKTVTVNYTGWLYNASAVNFHGTQFDTSIGGQPFPFVLGAGGVIPGWDQGVVGMKVGGKRTLIIPSSLGYGANGAGGGRIPPNAALVFDIEVLSVQ